MRQFVSVDRNSLMGGSSCGNSDRPLGLPLDALDWRGPGLVPVSPLGEDQFLVALGGWSLPYQ